MVKQCGPTIHYYTVSIKGAVAYPDQSLQQLTLQAPFMLPLCKPIWQYHFWLTTLPL